MNTFPTVKNAITTVEISGRCISTIPAGTKFKVTIYDENQSNFLCYGLKGFIGRGLSLIAKHEFKIID